MRAAGLLSVLAAAFALLLVPSLPIQALALFALAFIASCRLYSAILAAGISVRRLHPLMRTHRFTSCRIELEVENRTRLPVHYILAQDRHGELGSSGGNAVSLSLRPRETLRWSYEVTGYRRGSHPLGPAEVRGADPFGFFPWKVRERTGGRLIVYPSVHAMSLPPASLLPGGNTRMRNPLLEDLTRYRSLRTYTPGDEPRRIHWRASAAAGELMTREFESYGSGTAAVLLDLTDAGYPLAHRSSLKERAIETAASLIHHMAGRDTGLFVATEHGSFWFAPRAGLEHAVVLLEALACVEAGPSGPPGVSASFVRAYLCSERPSAPATRFLFVGGPPAPDTLAALGASLPASSTLELFVLSRSSRERFAGGSFASYRVKEYGDVLIET